MRAFIRRNFSRLHKELVERNIVGKRRHLIKLMEHNTESLPRNVSTEKLEEAYRALEGYEFVLRKRAHRS